MKKTVVISGGSRGIGRSIAEKFCNNNYKVIIIAKSLTNLEKTKQDLLLKGFNIDILTCDISNLEQVKSTVNLISKLTDNIDVLINNAGISKITPIDSDNYELWEKQISVNLIGTYYLTREIYLKMKKNNSGRIINIASIYGLIGGEAYSAYSASKHGLLGLNKSLALELAKYNITVNAICPGWVKTEMFDQDFEELSKEYNIEKEFLISEEKNSIPLKEFIEPNEIADLALYLASDKAKNITGQSINLSGGLGV